MKYLNKKSSPGDLFYIPAISREGCEGFVVARYIELIPVNVGYLIEVFQKFYTVTPSDLADIDLSIRLFRPIMFDMSFRYVPRWRVLLSDSTYAKSVSDYENIGFGFHTYAWIGGQRVTLPQSELRKFEESICWRTHHIVFRVNAHLAGLFGPSDRYDYHKVPGDQRIDNPLAMKKT